MIRAWAPAALICALFGVVAGCGGGEDEDDFVKAGNEACSKARQQSPPLDSLNSRQEVNRALDGLVEVSREQATRIKELDPPDEKKSQADQLVGALERRTGLLEKVRTATREDGPEGFNRALRQNAQSGVQTNQDADRLARELGLDDCLRSSRDLG